MIRLQELLCLPKENQLQTSLTQESIETGQFILPWSFLEPDPQRPASADQHVDLTYTANGSKLAKNPT